MEEVEEEAGGDAADAWGIEGAVTEVGAIALGTVVDDREGGAWDDGPADEMGLKSYYDPVQAEKLAWRHHAVGPPLDGT